MKLFILLNITFLVIVADKLDTYHYIVKDLYDLGNQIRTNPGKLSGSFKNETAQ